MYSVREVCPGESTKRSRPTQVGSVGSWRRKRWKMRYAAGASDMAVPGCPFPTFCTASIARTRAVSTARWSDSLHSKTFGVVLTLAQGSFRIL